MPRYADGFLLAVPEEEAPCTAKYLEEGRKNLEGARRLEYSNAPAMI